MLTLRGFEVLTKLLETTDTIPLKHLSEEFNVSTRMIKYELDDVKNWLRQHGIEVASQQNKGISLRCTAEKRSEMMFALPDIKRKYVYLNQEARVNKMLLFMLINPEYMTAAHFSEWLNVSRNTSMNDMKKIDEFLTPWKIELERKHGTGYRLQGDELSIRLLFEHLLHEELTNSDIYAVMSRITGQRTLNQAPIIFSELLPFYEMIEEEMAQLLTSIQQHRLDESEIIRILFRLTISVTRMNAGMTLKDYRVLKNIDRQDFIGQLMGNICRKMDYPVFEEEYYYVSGEKDRHLNQLDLVQVTKDIIQYVSDVHGIYYHKDSNLYHNLFAHLTLRFQKGEMNFIEINPFTKELKQKYASLFRTVQEACQLYLAPQKVSIPESFVSLIVLHFIVSFEKKFNQKGKIRTLYVCSTGKGVARFIKNRIEREVYDLEIVGNCSIMEVEEICRREEVDLIISVFSIETELPLVVIEPLPSKSDVLAIKTKVGELLERKNFQFNHLLENVQEQTTRQDAEFMSQEIILKGFEINYELQFLFEDRIDESKKQALTLHIFLLVHRVYFNKQYKNASNPPYDRYHEGHVQTIQRILEAHDILASDAEVLAIVQYLK